MTWPIRPLDPAGDANDLYELWHRALPTWPIPRERLEGATTAGFVVQDGSRVVGAVAVQRAGVAYLVVDPDLRRRGIGSALHDAALASLRDKGVSRAVLGAAGGAHVWPGIPRDLPEAVRFFGARGWDMGHVSSDLTLDLTSYVPPQGAVDRTNDAGVTFALARESDAPDLIAYETREHPNWVIYFEKAAASAPGSILIGRDRDGRVIAALLMEAPPRYLNRWSTMLGEDAAEIGCVGVAAGRNGEGIGTALMAIATERVREAGARTAYLSWTVRWSFYARLGYRVWREYQMSERTL